MAQNNKQIYYLAVARGQTVLAEYFPDKKSVQFREFTSEIAKKIKVGKAVSEFDKYDYITDRESSSRDLIYAVVVQKGFNKNLGFEMIDTIRGRFASSVDVEVIATARALQFNPEFQGELKQIYVGRSDERPSIR